MPYGFIGFAVGRASIARSASVFISAVDANPGCVEPPDVCLPPYSFSQSESDIKNNAFAYGWAAGGGMDWALTPHIFVRGELEYVSFPNLYHSSISISTAMGCWIEVLIGAGSQARAKPSHPP